MPAGAVDREAVPAGQAPTAVKTALKVLGST